jgi:hypothetical protein
MTIMSDDLLARLLDKVEHRFYGKYRAFVSDNADPEHRGRLRLRIPSVLGKDVVSGWALPCAPYGGTADQGFFFIPDKDAGVWVEFEAGLLEYPVWVGTFWSKPGGGTEVPKPADSQSPPTSKLIKTLKHSIELADDPGKELIKIADAANKNTVIIDSTGITVEDKAGNKITLDSGGVTIKSTSVKLGDVGAAEPFVLGTKLKTALDTFFKTLVTHTHTGNLGAPTTPPVPPLVAPVLDTALSQQHKVDK